MKAILTKYRAANNFPAAYTATDRDGNRASVAIDGNWTDSVKQGHEAAVRALCAKMHWQGSLVRGCLVGVGEIWVWRQSGLNCADEIAVGYDKGAVCA